MIYSIISILAIILTLIYYRRPIKYYKPPPTPKVKKQKQTIKCPNFLVYKTIRRIPKGYKINTNYILTKGTAKMLNFILERKNSFAFLCESCAITDVEICEIEFVSKYYEFMYVSRMLFVYSFYFKQIDKILRVEKQNGMKFSRSENAIIKTFCNEVQSKKQFAHENDNTDVLRPIKTKVGQHIEKMYKMGGNTKLIGKIYVKYFVNDQFVCKDGDPLDCVFVVLSGSFIVTFDNEDNNFEIGVGDVFGYFNSYFELTGYSIKASSDCLVAYLPISEFRKELVKEEDFNFVILKKLDPLFFKICAECEWKQYMPGEVFATSQDCISIVYQGNVKETSSTEEDKNETEILEESKENTTFNSSKTENDLFNQSSGSSCILPRSYEISNKQYTTNKYRSFFGPGKVLNNENNNYSSEDRQNFECIKKTDILIVPCAMIKNAIKTLPSFALDITSKNKHKNRRKHCKTVLIVHSDERYCFITGKLQEAIRGNVLSIQESGLVFADMRKKLVDCNRFYNSIRNRELHYDLILIILEKGFDSIAKQIVNYCDTLLLIGKIEPTIPLFCSVEIVNIYQDRAYGNKISKLFNFDNLKMKTFVDWKKTIKQKYEDYKSNVQNSEDKRLKNKRGTKAKESNTIKAKNKTTGKQKTLSSKQGQLDLSFEDYDKNNSQIFVKYDRIHHISSPQINNFSQKDFERLGRSLLDERIGLVLSGGGARGLAHIGVIQALEEEGIPIDIIGGTSMGAFIGALYARNCDNISVYKDTKHFVSKISSKWRVFFDLTYPTCSMFTGHAFNRVLIQIFNSLCIEDLWIDYFCISTNVTLFKEVVHRKGLLWRFVRASMSLAGYLPPICEEEDGNINLLLDGGYLNNIPIDVMRNIGAEKIIAIDVGSTVINDHYNYGETLNGFYVLFQRFFGRNKFLSMNEIQYRLAYLSDQNKSRIIDENVFIIRPEIDGYKSFDFNKDDEIIACGYTYGRKIIKEWKQNGIYKKLVASKRSTKRRFSI